MEVYGKQHSTKSRWKKEKTGSYLMHLQVGVGSPHLRFQGIVGISSVVFQTATLLQMGLELLSAPPKQEEKEDATHLEFTSGEHQLPSAKWIRILCRSEGFNPNQTIHNINDNQIIRCLWVAKLYNIYITIKDVMMQEHQKPLTFLSCFHLKSNISSLASH